MSVRLPSAEPYAAGIAKENRESARRQYGHQRENSRFVRQGSVWLYLEAAPS